MKRFIPYFSVLVLMASFSPVPSEADLAKEGSGEYRSGRSAQLSILKLGKEYMQINYDETGIVVEAPANSPFYNASFNTMGTIQAVNGIFTYSGAALWTRPNGEEIYGIFTGEGKLGEGSTTSLQIVGGKGECAGITGSMDLRSGPSAKSSKQGWGVGTTVGKVNWKIP